MSVCTKKLGAYSGDLNVECNTGPCGALYGTGAKYFSEMSSSYESVTTSSHWAMQADLAFTYASASDSFGSRSYWNAFSDDSWKEFAVANAASLLSIHTPGRRLEMSSDGE